MNRQPIGIRSLAVSFPSEIRTNDYWREKYPELIEQAEQKSLAKVFPSNHSTSEVSEANLWKTMMTPYLTDPFRGAVERRILGLEESSLTLENQAAKNALDAANITASEIDLMLVSSLFPENIVPGNASLLAGQLGIQGAALNLESTCMSALAGLQTASAMIHAGEYKNVLVVVSSTYSRFVDENDTFSFCFGDGASAFIVGNLNEKQGVLATKIVNTSETYGAFFCEPKLDENSNFKLLIKNSETAGQVFKQVIGKYIKSCCEDVALSAGFSLDQIDFFIFHTPTAWYCDFCTHVLGIDNQKTIDCYSQYANCAAVLPMANLYHAVQNGRIKENDLVLVYTMGFSSNVGATVMRWGNTSLGKAPTPSPSQEKILLEV